MNRSIPHIVFVVAAAAITHVPVLAQAQDTDLLSLDVVVGDDGNDAKLRAAIAAAPLLDYERVDILLDPPLDVMQVSAVTADRDGNLLILQRGSAAAPVIVATPTGRVQREFGAGLFRRPHSIRIDRDGNIWTVDSNTSIVRSFTPAGEPRLEIAVGDVPDPTNPSCAASDIAFGADGRFFVADGYCNARIVVYAADGTRVGEWGRPGNGPGEFDLPHSIAMSPEGVLFVADRENGRVQWFTQAGDYVGEWHYGGRVLSVAFGPAGRLFISAEPKGAEPQQEAALLEIDRDTGRVIGRIDDFGHELSVGADGSLLPASLGGRITFYRP
jgi:hypothetical protein